METLQTSRTILMNVLSRKYSGNGTYFEIKGYTHICMSFNKSLKFIQKKRRTL